MTGPDKLEKAIIDLLRHRLPSTVADGDIAVIARDLACASDRAAAGLSTATELVVAYVSGWRDGLNSRLPDAAPLL